jgi:hypothetical protein
LNPWPVDCEPTALPAELQPQAHKNNTRWIPLQETFLSIAHFSFLFCQLLAVIPPVSAAILFPAIGNY